MKPKDIQARFGSIKKLAFLPVLIFIIFLIPILLVLGLPEFIPDSVDSSLQIWLLVEVGLIIVTLSALLSSIQIFVLTNRIKKELSVDLKNAESWLAFEKALMLQKDRGRLQMLKSVKVVAQAALEDLKRYNFFHLETYYRFHTDKKILDEALTSSASKSESRQLFLVVHETARLYLENINAGGNLPESLEDCANMEIE